MESAESHSGMLMAGCKGLERTRVRTADMDKEQKAVIALRRLSDPSKILLAIFLKIM